MSGPKTSRYSLTPEQRRILEEQRKCRRERGLIQKKQADLRSIIAESDSLLTQSEHLPQDFETLQHVRSCREETMTAVLKALSMTDADGSAALQLANQHLQALSAELAQQNRRLRKELQQTQQGLQEDVLRLISGGFQCNFELSSDSGVLRHHELYQKIQAELTSVIPLILTDAQQQRLQTLQERLKQIEDLDFLKNFHTMSVASFIHDCRSHFVLHSMYGEKYERELFLYQSNAQELGIEPEQIPFTEEGIALLSDKLQQTEEMLRFREEQAYISRCVDETMREMGYAVVGEREIVKRSGKKYHSELYMTDDQTAVNITYSSDGQITMELGGLDHSDRLPTHAECTALEAHMRQFCDEYRQIQTVLRNKGIVTSHISLMPPDARFAQIINLSQYNLTQQVLASDFSSGSKHKHETLTQKAGETDGEV